MSAVGQFIASESSDPAIPVGETITLTIDDGVAVSVETSVSISVPAPEVVTTDSADVVDETGDKATGEVPLS